MIAPAIGEELLCRGVLQRTLARWIPPSAAIALAALAFGWLHMEWVHGFFAASIGCYLGLAAYWSDSTRPAIAAHATNNFAALLGSSGLMTLGLPVEQALALGLALAGLGLVWAWRSRPRGVATPHPGLQPGADSADA